MPVYIVHLICTAALKLILSRILAHTLDIHCTCMTGVVAKFHFVYILSLDIDECTLNTHNCQHNCHDTNGSFNCSCNDGYRLKTDNANCSGMSLIIESSS